MGGLAWIVAENAAFINMCAVGALMVVWGIAYLDGVEGMVIGSVFIASGLMGICMMHRMTRILHKESDRRIERLGKPDARFGKHGERSDRQIELLKKLVSSQDAMVDILGRIEKKIS